MLAEFVPNLRDRQRSDLEVHESRDAPHAVAQLVVYRVVNAFVHREPSRHAKRGQAASEDQEIPSGKPEADRSLLQVLSSSRSEYPIPRIV